HDTAAGECGARCDSPVERPADRVQAPELRADGRDPRAIADHRDRGVTVEIDLADLRVRGRVDLGSPAVLAGRDPGRRGSDGPATTRPIPARDRARDRD